MKSNNGKSNFITPFTPECQSFRNPNFELDKLLFTGKSKSEYYSSEERSGFQDVYFQNSVINVVEDSNLSI